MLYKHTYYNNVRVNDYSEPDGYLDGVEIVSESYSKLLPDYTDDPKTLLILDPPYVCTAQGSYKKAGYFGMVEFLRLMSMVRPPFIFFSSTRSEFLDYLNLVSECRLDGWERFDGCQKVSLETRMNHTAGYEDNMVFKF